ncbi:hypothetical protein ACFPL4_36390, partial [Streptomyces atroolivaceus]
MAVSAVTTVTAGPGVMTTGVPGPVPAAVVSAVTTVGVAAPVVAVSGVMTAGVVAPAVVSGVTTVTVDPAVT